MTDKFISAGTKILCPSCKDHVGTVKEDLPNNYIPDYQDVDWVQSVKMGDIGGCKKCSAHWYYSRIYLESGWWPH